MSRHAASDGCGTVDLLSPILRSLDPLQARVRALLADGAPAPARTVQPESASSFQDANPITWSDLQPDPKLLLRTLRFLLTDLGVAGYPGGYTGEYSEREANFLLALGHDLRKHGLEASHYDALAQAVGQAGVDVLKLDEEEQETFRDAADLTCHLLAIGAQRSTATATRAARVVDVVSAYPGDEAAGRAPISIVRLQEDTPQPWWTGQYLDIRTPYGEAKWQYLRPAIPSNSDGLIEFHVRGDEPARRAIVEEAQVGDQWVIGTSYGFLSVDAEDQRPVCMIAESTGLAPLRALLLDLALNPTPPRTTLYFGADTVAELYDLQGLLGFAQAWEWLTVVPVVAEPEPELLEPDAEPVAGPVTEELDGLLRVGHAVNAAIKDGAWRGARVLISGGCDTVTGGVDALVAAGADPAQLSFDKA